MRHLLDSEFKWILRIVDNCMVQIEFGIFVFSDEGNCSSRSWITAEILWAFLAYSIVIMALNLSSQSLKKSRQGQVQTVSERPPSQSQGAVKQEQTNVA